MNRKQQLQRIGIGALQGILGYLVCLVGYEGYYPFILAFYAAGCLGETHPLFLYIGIAIGIGTRLSVAIVVKYIVMLVVLTVVLRIGVWMHRGMSGIGAGIVAAAVSFGINAAGNIFFKESASDWLLAGAEAGMTLGATILFHYLLVWGQSLLLERSEEKQKEQVVEACFDGEQNGKVEAFANAMQNLAQIFGKNETEERYWQEDIGILEEELTGKLCTSCEGCAVCWNNDTGNVAKSLRQMLQAVASHCPKQEVLERKYLTQCPSYEGMVDEAILALGRMELNNAWFRRMGENRQLLGKQFLAMSGLLLQWKKKDCCLDEKNKRMLSFIHFEALEKGFEIRKLHIYENAKHRKYLKLEVKSRYGQTMSGKRFLSCLEHATGMRLRLPEEARGVWKKEPLVLTIYEEGEFFLMHGVATKKKTGSYISGDSFVFFEENDGNGYVAISDGMGSGSIAARESEFVLELLEHLIRAGFGVQLALRLMNSALILTDEREAYSTLDLAEFDLHEGKLLLYKIGAAVSFLVRGNTIRIIGEGSLPTGASQEMGLAPMEEALETGDFLVMVTDGVLEYLQNASQCKNKYREFCEILSGIETENAGAFAEEVLRRIDLKTAGYARDDMTILVTGIWKK